MGEGGSLRNYLNHNFSSMTGNEKLRLATDIAKGIKCLDEKGIIHRDLVRNVIYERVYYLGEFEETIIILQVYLEFW